MGLSVLGPAAGYHTAAAPQAYPAEALTSPPSKPTPEPAPLQAQPGQKCGGICGGTHSGTQGIACGGRQGGTQGGAPSGGGATRRRRDLSHKTAAMDPAVYSIGPSVELPPVL